MFKENFRYSTIGLCIVVFIIFILQTTIGGFTDSYNLIGPEAFSRPWILVTSIFLHGGLEHLMYNLFALALFGIILENIIGTKKFMLLFFISGILGALALLRPNMTIWIYFMPMPMYLAGIVYLIINFFGAYLGIGNTGYIAHLSGLVVGAYFGYSYRNKYGEHKPYTRSNELIDKYLDEYEKENKLRK